MIFKQTRHVSIYTLSRLTVLPPAYSANSASTKRIATLLPPARLLMPLPVQCYDFDVISSESRHSIFFACWAILERPRWACRHVNPAGSKLAVLPSEPARHGNLHHGSEQLPWRSAHLPRRQVTTLPPPTIDLQGFFLLNSRILIGVFRSLLYRERRVPSQFIIISYHFNRR